MLAQTARRTTSLSRWKVQNDREWRRSSGTIDDAVVLAERERGLCNASSATTSTRVTSRPHGFADDADQPRLLTSDPDGAKPSHSRCSNRPRSTSLPNAHDLTKKNARARAGKGPTKQGWLAGVTASRAVAVESGRTRQLRTRRLKPVCAAILERPHRRAL